MKTIEWKSLIITSVLCLLPIVLGASVYDVLPNNVAVHWNINNEPDGYASKEFFVFMIPFIMMAIQIFNCIIYDINSNRKSENSKVEKVVKSIIPLINLILYVVTILWALGTELDIRKVVCFLVGIIIIIIGKYMPEITYEESKKLQRSLFLKNEEVWNKVKRKFGCLYITAGLLILTSILLIPIYSLIALIIFAVFSIGISIYAIVISRKMK